MKYAPVLFIPWRILDLKFFIPKQIPDDTRATWEVAEVETRTCFRPYLHTPVGIEGAQLVGSFLWKWAQRKAWEREVSGAQDNTDSPPFSRGHTFIMQIISLFHTKINTHLTWHQFIINRSGDGDLILIYHLCTSVSCQLSGIRTTNLSSMIAFDDFRRILANTSI